MDAAEFKSIAKLIRLFDPDSLREKTKTLRENFERSRNREPTKPTRAQARRQEMSNHIAANFGCQSAAVRQLVEMMNGESLPPPTTHEGSESLVELVVGAVMVAGSMALAHGIDSDGDATLINCEAEYDGYHSPAATDWRPATEEEVESFIEQTRYLVSNVS